MKKKTIIILLVIALILVFTAQLFSMQINAQAQNLGKKTTTQTITKVTPVSLGKVDQYPVDQSLIAFNNASKTVVKKTNYTKSTTLKKSTKLSTAPVKHTRIATGKDKTLSFKKGDTVYGYTIKINGKEFTDKVLKNAPMNGTVTNGVIWPWSTEIVGASVINNKDITALVKKPCLKPTPKPTPAPTPFVKNKRIETGVGKTIFFRKGDTIYGQTLKINGKTYINKVIKDAPMYGYVTSGVIWPTTQEIAGVTIVSNEEITSIVIVPTPTPLAPKSNRVETGSGKSLTFKVGDSICGYKVVFDNGKVYSNGVAVKNSPFSGTVTDGVVNPSEAEYKNLRLINPKVDQPDNSTRQVTATNGTIYFSIHDTVVAKIISINGKTYYDAIIIDSPYAGYITNGIIWPTAAERCSFKLVDPINDPTQLHARLVTATNGTISFNKGDSVYGKEIIINDKLYQNTYIVNATGDGKVTNGVVWPNDSDIPKSATKVIFP